MKPRPIGVSILAVLYFVGAASYIALATISIVNRDLLRRILEALTPGGGAGPAPLLRMGAMLPLYFLVMVGVSAALGLGMWNLKNWARIITLILIGLSLVGTMVEMAPVLSHLSVGALLLDLLRLCLSIFFAWYLFRPAIRAAFKAGARASAGV